MAVAANSNPFLGLVPYDEKHALYGRDADVELILGRLWTSPLTILFAGSGVGKTSFLKAKLVPSLREAFGPENVAVPDETVREDPAQALISSRQLVKAGQFTKTGSLIAYDQFEEVFQRLTDPAKFQQFGTQLARIAHDSRLNLRLLLVVREEFLSELSRFDDFVPGVLSNYYRLERLTPVQARLIIESTARECHVSVSPQVELLIRDLSTIHQKRSTGQILPDSPREVASGQDGQCPATSIDPPYLQIACQRAWAREEPAGSALFLQSYQAGQADVDLKHYCGDKLSELSLSQRLLFARAVEHLTGRHEAKKAVPITELAEAMGTRRINALGRALDRLVAEHSKVLRRLPSGMYQLYHDMYARHLWQWKEKQLATKRWATGGLAALAVLVVTWMVVWPFFNWATVYYVLSRPEEYGTPRELSLVMNTRNAFAQGMLLRPFIGDPLWRGYTKRLETLHALSGNPYLTTRYRLAGLSITPGSISSETANSVLGVARYLDGIIGVTDVVDAAIVDDKDDVTHHPRVVVATGNGMILRWPGTADDVRSLRDDAILRSGETGADAQIQGLHRLLCVNSTGTKAVMAWIEQSASAGVPAGNAPEAVSTLRVGIFDTTNSKRTNAISWPLLGEAGGRSAESGALQTIALSALQNMIAVFSADFERLAISDGQQVLVFGNQLTTPKALRVPDARKLAVGSKAIAVAAERGIPVAAPEVWNASDALEVTLWNLDGAELLAKGSLALPETASLILRPSDSAVLAKRNGQWVFAVPTGDGTLDRHINTPDVEVPLRYGQGTQRSPRDNVAPLAFDENTGVLLWMDSVSRLLFSKQESSPDQFVMLAASQMNAEGHGRRLASATLASFSNGRFATLDGQAIRIWSRPETLTFVDHPSTVAAGQPTSNSRYESSARARFDRRGQRDVPAAPIGALLSRWPSLARDEYRDARVSTRQNRALVQDDRNEFILGDADGRTHKLPAEITEATFGPGPDRITALTPNLIAIYGPHSWLNGHDPEPEWRAPIESGLRLVHGGDEDSVVAYSTFWAHRLRQDTRTFGWFADWLYGRTAQWPEVTSIFQDVPLRNLVIDKATGKVTLAGTAYELDFDAQQRRERELRRTRSVFDWLTNITLLPCSPNESAASTGASTWRARYCQWEERTGSAAAFNHD